ncbi:MAG: nuclear transport factor 2 family protein [Rhizobiales bacterium]|nr:nuclear transport factor 2 family protein [Hyphomicrobiales bacterium]
MPTANEIRALLLKSNELFLKCGANNVTKAHLREIFAEDVEIHMPFGMPPAVGIDALHRRCELEAELFEHCEFEAKEPIIASNSSATYMSATVKDLKNDDFFGFEVIEIAEFNEDNKISKKMLYIELEALEHAFDKETLAKLFV